MLRHMRDRKTEHVTGTVFHRGVVEGWDVVVAEVGPGNAPAAVIAERAIGRFGPAVALFVGVAGGIKDVAIGDVVVATKVYGYESGKETDRGRAVNSLAASTMKRFLPHWCWACMAIVHDP